MDGVLITWPAVTSLGCLIVIATGGIAVYVRLSIEASYTKLFERLNGKYVSQGVCGERNRDVQRRMASVEGDVRTLEATAHRSPCENSQRMGARLAQILGTGAGD